MWIVTLTTYTFKVVELRMGSMLESPDTCTWLRISGADCRHSRIPPTPHG